MKLSWSISLLIGVLVESSSFAATQSQATTYWIAATGGTTTGSCAAASGTSDPGVYYRTFAAIVAAGCIHGGDTVKIKDGTYNEGIYSINGNKIPSGTPGASTIIQSATPSVAGAASSVFLAPPGGVVGEQQGIYLSGSHSYITIDGIGMSGQNHSSLDWPGCCGLQLDGTNGNIHHITYKNSEFKNNKCGSWGAQGADDITVQGNWFYGDTCNSFSHGIYANQPSNGWLIEGNIIDGFVDYGIQIYTCCSTNYIIRYNIFRNNGFGLGGTASGSGMVVYGNNHQIYGNIFHENFASGLLIEGGSGVKVYNNTVYRNNTLGKGFGGIVWGNGSGTIIKNNIVYDNGGADLADINGTQTPTFGNNHCTNAGPGCAQFGDPLFADPGNRDFVPLNGSPVIGAGTPYIDADISLPFVPDIGAMLDLISSSLSPKPAIRPERLAQARPAKRQKAAPVGIEERRKRPELASLEKTEKHWTVQVLATPDRDIATECMEKLKAKGYDAFLVEAEIDDTIWHRVRLGNFETRRDANILGALMRQKEGFRDAFVVDG